MVQHLCQAQRRGAHQPRSSMREGCGAQAWPLIALALRVAGTPRRVEKAIAVSKACATAEG